MIDIVGDMIKHFASLGSLTNASARFTYQRLVFSLISTLAEYVVALTLPNLNISGCRSCFYLLHHVSLKKLSDTC